MTSDNRAPRLSVVVPAYRVAEYLPRCLDSILAEPAEGSDPEVLEVVVVDDHCPAGSGQVAQRYADRDPRVRVVRLATNVGLGRARNAGLEHARGEYLWFVDGDDWLPPGAVPAVLARTAATLPDVLVVDHTEVHPDGRTRRGGPAGVLAAVAGPGPLTDHPRLLELAHSACTKVVRRTFLRELGLRFQPGWYEDSAYTHPLLLAAARIDGLDRISYCYRRREVGAITTSVSARHFDVFVQYERMWTAVAALAGREAFRPVLFRLMVDHLLVIAGNDHRVPARLRREFFGLVVRDYRQWLPSAGYRPPGGMAGLKHRLLRWDAYRSYAALRLAWRGLSRLRSLGTLQTLRVRPATAGAAPEPAELLPRVPAESR